MRENKSKNDSLSATKTEYRSCDIPKMVEALGDASQNWG